MSANQPIDPDARRARLITTYEGKYLHVGDFRAALGDDAFVDSCALMLKVGLGRGDTLQDAIRAVIGNALYVLSGEVGRERPAADSGVKGGAA